VSIDSRCVHLQLSLPHLKPRGILRLAGCGALWMSERLQFPVADALALFGFQRSRLVLDNPHFKEKSKDKVKKCQGFCSLSRAAQVVLLQCCYRHFSSCLSNLLCFSFLTCFLVCPSPPDSVCSSSKHKKLENVLRREDICFSISTAQPDGDP
jgi:hypothetical protein